MRTCLLTLGMATLLIFAACNKKQAQNTTEQSTNQQNPPSASAPAADAGATPAPAPVTTPESPPPPPEPPKPVVIPAGTVITVRLQQALGSKISNTGDTFAATVANPISVHGKVAIPASSSAQGTVVEAQAKGKIKGEARLQLALTKITIKGHTYPIETSMSSTTAKGKGKRTAATTGGGAAGGALIGGIAGGGKGAAIGAGVGAAAGFVGGAFTGNKQIELPAESVLSFELKEPVTLKTQGSSQP